MRLIDAEELRKAFKKSPVFTEVYLHYARQLIDDAPTVDLVSPTIKANISEEMKQKLIEELQKSHKLLVLCERRTGEWKETKYETVIGLTYRQIQCSNCGWGHEPPMWWNFCPNCGADMRKEDN